MRVSMSIAALLFLGSAVVVGCGESDTDANSSAVSSGASVQQTAGSKPTDPVARVAFEFLEAVRQGDIEAASSKLTPLALKRTSELEMSFSPPGSPTAVFQIGATDQIEPDKAIVESVWTDLDPDGNPQQEQIVWALRLVDGGWRISGMVAEVDPEQPAVIIDFENPGAIFSQRDSETAPAGSTPAAQTAKDPFQEVTNR